MILKLERPEIRHAEKAINRWQGIPYVKEWGYDNRELTPKEIEKDNYYGLVLYEPEHYENYNEDTKIMFTWIGYTTFNPVTGEENKKEYILTTLSAFLMNDEGKTVDKLNFN